MARQGNQKSPRRENVAAGMLRNHIVRATRHRAANDNPRPTAHTFKGILVWSAIISVAGMMAWSLYIS